MKLNLITLAIVVGVLIYLAWHSSAIAWTPWQIAGVAIAAPALLLLIAARLQLGSAFSVTAKASNLVTTGLYARIRNPIYFFGSFVILGAFIFLARPWLLLIFVVLIPIQILRSRKESQVLEEKFGDAYRQYRQKTWF